MLQKFVQRLTKLQITHQPTQIPFDETTMMDVTGDDTLLLKLQAHLNVPHNLELIDVKFQNFKVGPNNIIYYKN